MSAVLEKEQTRQAEQKRLDLLKTALERNKWGQFATPPALSLDIAKYAWDKLNHRKVGFRFLDPAIGTGSFFAALLQVFPLKSINYACGIELDEPFADTASALWKSHGLHVIKGDFTKQPFPEDNAKYNIILTNPPYVRHHHLAGNEKPRLRQLAEQVTGIRLSGLAGLYCYFLLIAHEWLAGNGLAVWLIPSEFMDVNYGDEVKRYLTDKVSLLHIHRFCPADVQFDDALVSSAVVIFEKQLPKANHVCLFSFGGTLTKPAKSEEVPLDALRQTAKWTSLPTNGNGRKKKTIVLGDLFAVKRGLATGNNSFFILPKSALKNHGIPLSCVRPILPSPRYVKQEIIEGDEGGWPILDEPLALIDCRLTEEEIHKKYPKFGEYLEQGKKEGCDKSYLASRRVPWYSQEKREYAPFLCTYMGRNRERPFRFIWNMSKATAANVFLLLYPKRCLVVALKNEPGLYEKVFRELQAIHADEFIGEGRVYGGGLFKMEPSELMRLPADNIAAIADIKRESQATFF